MLPRLKIYLEMGVAVSSIYIWSEIFRSPSEAKYGGQGALKHPVPSAGENKKITSWVNT